MRKGATAVLGLLAITTALAVDNGSGSEEASGPRYVSYESGFLFWHWDQRAEGGFGGIARVRDLTALTWDSVEARVLWAEKAAEAVYAANIDGSGRSLVAADVRPSSMAVDWIGRRLYWLEAGKEVAAASGLWAAEMTNATRRARLIAGRFVLPWSLALDPGRGRLFWCDRERNGYNPYRLETAKLNGEGRRLLLRENAVIISLALDLSTARLYYSQGAFYGGSRSIHSMDYDGNERRRILAWDRRWVRPDSLNVFADSLHFLAGQSSDIIVSVPKEPATNVSQVAVPPEVAPSDECLNFCPRPLSRMRLAHPSIQPPGENPCQSSDQPCEDDNLCLLAEGAGFSCLCRSGIDCTSSTGVTAPTTVTTSSSSTSINTTTVTTIAPAA